MNERLFEICVDVTLKKFLKDLISIGERSRELHSDEIEFFKYNMEFSVIEVPRSGRHFFPTIASLHLFYTTRVTFPVPNDSPYLFVSATNICVMNTMAHHEIESEALRRGMNPTLTDCFQRCPYLLLSMIIISSGGVLIGFDIATLNGILIMPSFIKAMDAENLSEARWSEVSSWMTSSLSLGAAVSSLLAAPLADMIGPKNSISLSLLIIILGGCIQIGAVAQYMMVIGRLTVGVAIGLLSSIIPLYLAELSPKSIRGFIVSMFQVMMAIGILLAYTVTLGFNNTAQTTAGNNWRYILGFQAAMPIGVFILGALLPESPRWLIKIGNIAEAKRVLESIRICLPLGKHLNESGELVSVSNIDIECNLMCREHDNIDKTVSLVWYDFSPLFSRSILLRTSNGIMINILGQLTGFNSIIYYSSMIFKDIGITADKTTALIGVLNVVVTFLSIIVMDKAGRRFLLVCGSVCMFCCLAALGTIVSSFEPSKQPASAQAIAAFICLFVVSFAYSYGPIAWLYPAEIFPIQVRTKGVSLSTCAGWLTNFVVNQSVPLMILPGSSIGGLGGTFLFFAAWTLIMTPWAMSHVFETTNMTLEDIDNVFQVKSLPEYSRYITSNLSFALYFGNQTMVEYTQALAKVGQESVDNSTEIQNSDCSVVV